VTGQASSEKAKSQRSAAKVRYVELKLFQRRAKNMPNTPFFTYTQAESLELTRCTNRRNALARKIL